MKVKILDGTYQVKTVDVELFWRESPDMDLLEKKKIQNMMIKRTINSLQKKLIEHIYIDVTNDEDYEKSVYASFRILIKVEE